MLSDGDRERIRLEEVYRFEVKHQLEADKTRPAFGSQLIRFLNTSLGLWLISAIFITGLGSLLTHFVQHEIDLRAQERRIEHLDTEISYRFSQVLQRLFTLSYNQEHHLGEVHPGEVGATVQLLYEPGQSIRSLYPEFQDRGVPNLVADLREQLPSGKDRAEIDRILPGLTSAAPISEIGDDARSSAGSILRSFVLPRWKRRSFLLVACGPSDPFC